MLDKNGFIRVDDYGFVTYLSLLGCELQCERKVFEVRLTPGEFESHLTKYLSSNYKKFDDESRLLKKKLKTSAPA